MKISRRFVHERLKLPEASGEDDVFQPLGGAAPGRDADGPRPAATARRPEGTTARLARATAQAPDDADGPDESGAGQDALDALCGGADAALRDAGEALLAPLLAELEAGLSPAELEGRLAELFPALDESQLTDLLTRLLFVAALYGYADARAED